MKFFKKTLTLCRKIILEPSQAALDMLTVESISEVGIIFTISSIVNAYLLRTKPIDFPSEFSEKVLSVSKKTFFYYLSLDLFGGIIFIVIFCGFFVFFAGLIKNGKLVIKLPILITIVGIFSGLVFYFRHLQVISTLETIIVLAVVIYRSILQKNNFIAFLKFVLASNFIVLIIAPLCFLAILINSENFYIFSSTGASIWTLVLLVKAAKIIVGGTALRQTLAIFFSGLATFIFFYMLKNAGIINSETLKFIMFM